MAGLIIRLNTRHINGKRKTNFNSCIETCLIKMGPKEVAKSGSSYTFRQRNDAFVRNRQDRNLGFRCLIGEEYKEFGLGVVS